MGVNIINEYSVYSLPGTMRFPEIINKLIFTSTDFEAASTSNQIGGKNALHIKPKVAIDYQTFLQRTISAIFCLYRVFITRKKVTYFKRDSRQYVESFPTKKS